MRVFVLNAGRCGSTTFARACTHIGNFTSGHETRSTELVGRCDYPDRHIEVDNRLSWFLGTIDRLYGNRPLYVHLTRDRDETARSHAVRIRRRTSIVQAFGRSVLPHREQPDWQTVSRLYVDTVTDNIDLFLADKTHVIRVPLTSLHAGFDVMWDTIGAEGDRVAAHAELDVRHNKGI